MDEVECKRDSDKPNDETFLLLSTSLNSISSSVFATQTNTLLHEPNVNNPYTRTTSPTTIASDRNNRTTSATNTMALSKSTIVHTCCYKHHCQLSASHINNGEIQSSASKKLLLSVPLQRKRKRVIYNQHFIGAIGIDERNSNDLDLASDQRLVIAHYSCVEKFTKMYTPTIKDSGSQNNNDIRLSDDLISTVGKKDEQFTCSNDVISCESGDLKHRYDHLADNLKDQRMCSTSPMSDEGLANASPYCSSGEEDDSRMPVHEKVERSSSSDSALGLDEEILAGMADLSPRNEKRRMTLTVTDIPLRPALLPVAEPTTLPDSPLQLQPQADFVATNLQSAVVVPSKMILEARIVEIPTSPPPVPQIESKTSYFGDISRRESSVSDEDVPVNVRIVRTPSVVVSDYSDDVLCGITLEELEFFRQQRKSSLGAAIESSRSSATENTDYLSDMSAASSCSNLNYCGSSISLLDDNYASVSGITTPERKLSNCSLCSTSQEDNEETNETNRFSTNLIDALNQQRMKKVCKCSLSKSCYPKPSE